MALLKINGTELPAPTTYSVQYSDIDSSDTGRAENGVMLRNRIRAGVVKISVSWSKLTQTETDLVLDAVRGVSCSVEYYGGSTAKEMYAGDRSLQLVCLGKDGARFDVSYNLIEF